MSGHKDDKGKPDLTLLPFDVLCKIAEARKIGADKYGVWNYMGGMDYRRVGRAALGHIGDFFDGLDADKDSGLHPLDHAMASLIILRWYTIHMPFMDNRASTERNKTARERGLELINLLPLSEEGKEAVRSSFIEAENRDMPF